MLTTLTGQQSLRAYVQLEMTRNTNKKLFFPSICQQAVYLLLQITFASDTAPLTSLTSDGDQLESPLQWLDQSDAALDRHTPPYTHLRSQTNDVLR